MKFRHTLGGILLLLTSSAPVFAEQVKDTPAPASPPTSSPVARDFCSSFVDAAEERRLLRLSSDLQASKDQLSLKIEELKEKSEKLKALIDERKAMQKKVGESLLKIYLQVEPEAAAQQLAKLDPSTAAEILVRMNAKRSGEILTLMEAKKAASLVAILTLQTSLEKESTP